MPHRAAPSLLGRSPCVRCGLDLARVAQATAAVWEWQAQQRMETMLLEGRTQVYGNRFLALPFFQGLRSLVAILCSPRGRELMGCLLGGAHVPESRSKVFELRPLAERRIALQAAWQLLEDWPHRFLHLAAYVGMRQADIEKLALSPAYWIDRVIDHMPGRTHRELSTDEVASIVRWLRAHGLETTWNTILNASGVGVPVRVGQPALRKFLLGMPHAGSVEVTAPRR